MSTELNQPAITARIIPITAAWPFCHVCSAPGISQVRPVSTTSHASLRRLSRRFLEFVELSCGSGFMYPLSAERFTVSS